jgi:RHS repeat-associated protein
MYDAAGTTRVRNVHGIGDHVPLISFLGDSFTPGIRRFLLADHQGSIIAAARSDGAVLAQNAYDAWGLPRPGNFGRFQYTGQLWIGELGLYHYKARVYDPSIERFLQVDPIGYDDQVDLYAYVANDPINSLDLTGMCETQTGSRICRSEGTTLVKRVTIPLRDENGNSNSSSAAQTTKDYTAEVRG